MRSRYWNCPALRGALPIRKETRKCQTLFLKVTEKRASRATPIGCLAGLRFTSCDPTRKRITLIGRCLYSVPNIGEALNDRQKWLANWRSPCACVRWFDSGATIGGWTMQQATSASTMALPHSPVSALCGPNFRDARTTEPTSWERHAFDRSLKPRCSARVRALRTSDSAHLDALLDLAVVSESLP